MKIGKSELKTLIKECLIEILSEGLGEQINEARRNVSSQRGVSQARNQTVQRHVPQQKKPQVLENTQMRSVINEVAGGDNVLKGILADTANTTLKTFIDADRKGAGSLTAHTIEGQIVEAHEPEDIFGADAVDRWASLAFESPKQK